MKKIPLFIYVLVISLTLLLFYNQRITPNQRNVAIAPLPTTPYDTALPLSIVLMQRKNYPGSDMVIEKTIVQTDTYTEYLTSYHSEGLKIYGLLTIPQGSKPKSGWPAILFNHGYIPPNEYSTTDSYTNIVRLFASSGYITFKQDYRGNGNSEGTPAQVYVSPSYVTDSLNALSSMKKYKDVNPNKIGIWGHSMGGNVTLHDLIITKDVKAAVIWSGVVGSYTDIINWWNKRISSHTLIGNDTETGILITSFVSKYQTPSQNPSFWNAIDPVHFLSSITSPILLLVGTGDSVVPYQFSETLYALLIKSTKTALLHEYPNADHNLFPNQGEALSLSLTYFDRYLK